MTTSRIFNFTEMSIIDNGIERYQEHEYELINGTNLNSPGEIRINIEQQDLLTLPSKAYLLFEGQLVKADGTAYAKTGAVALTSNGLMQLFSRITHQLSNQEIEAIYHPGQATTMLGILNYANDFQLAQGLNQLWYKDNTSTAVLTDNIGFATKQAYMIQKPTTKGTFSFCVPLSHIFGFCDDYDKVIYGLKHTITHVRQSDNDAVFRLAAVAAGKVNLNKISLFMPNLIPANVEKFKLYGEIEKKVTIPVSFRNNQQSTSFNWQLAVKTSFENPRYIIVGFQTSKRGDQTANPSIFDYCDLKNMYIMLNNNDRYPPVDYNLSFPNQ
ncbi:uncharacterized protein LOC136076263 [Hydra vulgaris]|uniref:Uncharacterized protein LOC136076263 n=1 Tax=Hydra vulgaris TaxID=6087 RepID=A0ABM4BA75_HYDVU